MKSCTDTDSEELACPHLNKNYEDSKETVVIP